MPTIGKGRGKAPSLLLSLFLCLGLALGLGGAAPAFAFTLGGTVANDVNGNGILDATDAPLGGISVTVQPAGGGLSATTTTATNGTYSFPNLNANTYTVTVGSAAGLLDETPASMTVTLSQDQTNVNFLFVVPGLIGGRVVSDLNGNGIAEPTEPGLPGVAVDISSVTVNGSGQTVTTLITTVVTSSDGTFFFPLQPAGTYLITAHPATGTTATGANAGSLGTAVVVDANNIRVVLNGSQSAAGLRFSERVPQTTGISGTVLDNTSKPIPNVVVEQLDAAQNLLNATLTDANGQYFFSSVAAGATYVIRVIPPIGMAIKQVSPSPPATALGTSAIQIVNFNPSNNYTNNNFVLSSSAVVSPVTPGSANAISGRVINDLNGNGVFDAGEPGLSGATLTLVATTGVSFGSTVTSSTGDFTFVNLPAGTYILTRTNPLGFSSTGVQPGVGGASLTLDRIQVTVAGTNNLYSGQLFLAHTTTVTPPPGTGVISGSVFRDVNANGVLSVPPDIPLQGVQMILQNQLGTPILQTFTDVNGAWAFGNLAAGTYRVVEVVPANYAAEVAIPGPGAVMISPTTLQVSIAGGVSGNNNFLNTTSVVSPTVGTISGSVFRDVNGNGVIDAGDTPISGVTIDLFTSLGTFIAQSTTDANGAWAFINVPPGTYQAAQVVPASLLPVQAFAGVNGFVLNPTTIQVGVVAGVNSGGNNFLDRGQATATSTISGSVIQDIDGNGRVNVPPDTPLVNAVVQLFSGGGSFLLQTTTDVNGAWAFRNLSPGSYRAIHVVPSNFAAVGAFPGVGGTAPNSTEIDITVSGGTYGSNNFLDRSTVVSPTVGIISGSVIRDVDANGQINIPPDVGLQGVTVQLFTSLGTFIAQSMTDVNGAWAFINVPPGSYQVKQIVPAGYTAESPTTLNVTAVAGVNQGNNNFLDLLSGVTPGTSTISGFALEDHALSGQPDDDPGLAGMRITLSNSLSQVIGTVVTDITGGFSFSGLANGTYLLTATPPSGLTATNAFAGVGGSRLSANQIRVTVTAGATGYPGHLFLAGP